MARARWVGVVAVLVFLHFALRPIFTGWFASPNLLVCAVLLSARGVRPGTAAALGFGLGLLEDAVAVTYFGLSTAMLTVLGYIGSRTRDLFLGEEPLFVGAYLFVGTWLVELVQAIPGGGAAFVHNALLRGPLSALMTAVVGYVALPVLRIR
jgi:rod shape-determining protein MreD